LQEAGQSLVWWKPYHSRIERAVFGAISQDGMEQAIERMKAGTLKKAESGRVTAKSRAYGYVFMEPGKAKVHPSPGEKASQRVDPGTSTCHR